MQSDVAAENEYQRNSWGCHLQQSVHRGGGAAGARGTETLLEVLDVEAGRPRREHACDVDSTHDAVELCEALAEAVGKLHRSEKQSTRPGDPVRQEPPLEWLVVVSHRVVRMDEEAFVVREDVSDHQAYEGKYKVFWAQP